jgi:hypothetical protein
MALVSGIGKEGHDNVRHEFKDQTVVQVGVRTTRFRLLGEIEMKISSLVYDLFLAAFGFFWFFLWAQNDTAGSRWVAVVPVASSWT